MLLFNYGCVGLCVLSVTTSCCIRTFEIIAVKQEKYRDREKIVPEKGNCSWCRLCHLWGHHDVKLKSTVRLQCRHGHFVAPFNSFFPLLSDYLSQFKCLFLFSYSHARFFFLPTPLSDCQIELAKKWSSIKLYVDCVLYVNLPTSFLYAKWKYV